MNENELWNAGCFDSICVIVTKSQVNIWSSITSIRIICDTYHKTLWLSIAAGAARASMIIVRNAALQRANTCREYA
jgi:hypothetical protein